MKEPRVFSLTERHAMGTSNHVDLFVNVAGHSRKCRMKTSPQTLLTGKNLVAFLKEVFLPQRYPDSVSSDYFEYQVWDSLQALFSSVSGTLAAHATFEGLGVGEKSASVVGATLTWMLKMSSGMLGSILFAYLQSSSLDAHSKQWRLFADVLNDLSLALAIVSPLFSPHSFVLLSCLSSLLSALVGVAGSTTRAAFRVHQARESNMADVCAKDNSQEQMVNLLGLALGFIVTSLINIYGQPFVWLMFSISVLFHLYCNVRAVKCVCMETLNPARFQILVTKFFLFHHEHHSSAYDVIGNEHKRRGSMSVKRVNEQEPLVLWNPLEDADLAGSKVKLGVSLTQINDFLEPTNDNPKVIYGTVESNSQTHIMKQRLNNQQFVAAFSSDVSSDQILESAFVLHMCALSVGSQSDDTKSVSRRTRHDMVSSQREFDFESNVSHFQSLYPHFKQELTSLGWKMDCSLLMVEDWRFHNNVSANHSTGNDHVGYHSHSVI